MSEKEWKRIALVPGSFDPVTLGHLDLVIRASSLFDEVVVAVLENSSKQPWFSAEGRVLMVQREMAALKNVRVVRFAGLLVDLAEKEAPRWWCAGSEAAPISSTRRSWPA